MKHLDNYRSLVLETNILSERLNTIIEYEKSLKTEKKLISNMIKNNENSIKKIEDNMCELKDIETKLYYEIVINGMGISKAIEKVAEETNKDVSTLWKNYYPNVKRKIQDIFTIKNSEKEEYNAKN